MGKDFNLPFDKDYYTKELDKKMKEYTQLLNVNHNLIGRVLTCHLLIEKYVTDFLNFNYGEHTEIEDLSLSLRNKLKLLPQIPPLALIKNGMKDVDNLRHKFAHTLNPEIKVKYIENVIDTIKNLHPDLLQGKDSIEIIEFFTNICCSIMMGSITFGLSSGKKTESQL